MPPHLALTTTSPAPVAVHDVRDWSMRAFAVVGVLAFVLLLAGLPLVSAALVAASSASTLAIIKLVPSPYRGRTAPETIVSLEARQTYRAILDAFAEIERVLAATPSPASRRVIERCRGAVDLCGRVATLGNPLQHYLDTHHPDLLRLELERLRVRTELAGDERTVSDLSRATAARARQLASYDDMAAMRDRIQARLELVHASLESFAAQLLKMQVVEEEDLALADQTLEERIDGIGDELDVLEAALAS